MTTAYIRCSRTASRSTRCIPAKLGLPPARAGADDRSGDPPRVWRGPLHRDAVERSDDDGEPDRRRSRSSSIRWSTGSGSGSASWRSAPASRCCRSARTRSPLAKMPGGGGERRRCSSLLRAARCRRPRCWRRRMHGAEHARTRRRRVSAQRRAREADAARDRLHVRRLRPHEHRRVPQGSRARRRTRCGRSWRRWSIRARRTTRSSQAFVAKYGSEEMLGAPIDRGFRRLAWLLPWSVGVGAAAAVGFVAVRWSRKPRADDRRADAADRPANWTSASTMSSETSTEHDRPRPDPPRRQRSDAAHAAVAVLRARGAGLRHGRDVSRRAARASPSSFS